MIERLGKGVKRYFKDNLGILCALVAMIVFINFWPNTNFLTRATSLTCCARIPPTCCWPAA